MESKRAADRMRAYRACGEERELTEIMNDPLALQHTLLYRHRVGLDNDISVKSVMTKCSPPE